MDENTLMKARLAAGEAAAALVEHGMTVGLGTGDSAGYAIRALWRRVQEEGLGLRCVPTSQRTAALAQKLGLPLTELDQLPGEGCIDLTIDGADEIDAGLRLIKGAGGALLREKLVAHASRRLVIVADTGKVVGRLGERRLLPVEIVPFGIRQTLRRLSEAFPGAALRREQAEAYVTDGGNRLVDVPLRQEDGADPEALHRRLKMMVGVVETGLFLCEAQVAFIGDREGGVRRSERTLSG